MKDSDRVQGFTLWELLLVLSICSILFLGIHYFYGFFSRHQALSTAEQFIHAIHLTQMSAQQSNGSVVFCGSSDHSQCDGNWSKGQIIKDLNTQKVLQRFELITPSIYLVWRSSLGKNEALQFDANGLSAQQGTFLLCQKKSRKILYAWVVNRFGRIRIEENKEALGGC